MALDRPPGAGSASRLGNYELLKELSGGGIGSTWLARASSEAEATSAGPVTILRIYRHLTKKAETADSILREAGMAERLRFPNVLSVLDARIADGEVFIVSDYVDGEPLGALVSAAGAEGLPLPVALRIAVDVLRALVSAHTAEPALVHGELNPTHVSVGIDGITRVSGLGVARAIAGLAPMGTRNPDRLAYAAPERVKAMAAHTEAPLDPRADVFSVGVILWELLSRQRLFSSKLEAAVIQKVLTAPVPPLAGLAGAASPAQLGEVVRTALERDPARRFESASAMLEALEAAGAEQIAGAEAVAATVSKLAGKTLEPRRTMIAAAMAGTSLATEARPAPRARGATLVGVAIPVPEGAQPPRGDAGARHAITAPSPRTRAVPAAPGGPPAAGGSVLASQLRPSSGAGAPKEAAGAKNGVAPRAAAGAAASNGGAPAGAGAEHVDIDTAWGAADEAEARGLPAARPPMATLPQIGPSTEPGGVRAPEGPGGSAATAAPAAAALKEQPAARAAGAAAPRAGEPSDSPVAARATPASAEGAAPRTTPIPKGPLPRPPRPPPPRSLQSAPPDAAGKRADAAAPAGSPAPVTSRAPITPAGSPSPATPRAPIGSPSPAPPRAPVAPAAPTARTTSRVPAVSPVPPAPPAPAAVALPTAPLAPATPRAPVAPATPLARPIPTPRPPAALAAPAAAPATPAAAPATSAATTAAPAAAPAASAATAAAPAVRESTQPSITVPPVAPTAPSPPAAQRALPPAPAGASTIGAPSSPTPATQEAPRGADPASSSGKTLHTPTGPQGMSKMWGRAASAVDRLGAGSTLGRYEILMPVAKGGMAAVWAARLQGTRGFQKIVAVKTMLPDVSDDPDFESMFLDEARVAARIRHPNVVEILDLGEEADVLYIVMEWVDGETASTLQKAAKPLGGIPQRLVLRIASQICAGLHNAHELRDDSGALLDLVHRDISPANVLISTAGFVKIVDFGVAKSKGRLHVTRAGGVIKGKTPYLSPEQLGGLPVDRRSDIFSLGALLYVLTTGLHPFRAETELSTVENIALKDPLPPRELNSAIPPDLEKIILKALAKDRENRFATCAEMQRAIDQVASNLGEPTTDEDVAAFVRQAVGDSQAKRAQDLRDAIAAADAAMAQSSEPRSGASPELQASPADASPNARSEGAPAAGAAAPAPASSAAGAAPAAAQAPREEESPISMEPISFEEIAAPARPVEVTPRLILAPEVQAGIPAEEGVDPVSSRPAARDAKPLRAFVPRALPAAGMPPRDAVSGKGGTRSARSMANDVGEVTVVDRSHEAGQQRKRLQLIVAGAAMCCVALGAVALLVRGGDERPSSESRVRVESPPASAMPSAAVTGSAEAIPAAAASPATPPEAQPPPEVQQPPEAASAEPAQPATAPPEATQEPPPAPPAEAQPPPPAAKAAVATPAKPAAAPAPTPRPRATSAPAKAPAKAASTAKPPPKKKYNPSGI
ncbi:uncharacterized protein SOCE26_011670 [Sorangium cellulosum]|uniref:Protein kinase domain-containing protein n=1 Tax=Sorangium cellulosum TaxID=56 RepID=A0A2L0EKF9_SORCE|nr:serine/threonine-protein kinase [Sorangium cellulosum]AUX39772.1 uncharacterized protein SOCE26_011670 [Sorangium cellulosum]